MSTITVAVVRGKTFTWKVKKVNLNLRGKPQIKYFVERDYTVTRQDGDIVRTHTGAVKNTSTAAVEWAAAN